MEIIKLPAKLENLQRMFDFIREASCRQGFADEQMNKIQLACEEALMNVISYAYPEGDGHVEIQCDNQENSLVITVKDSGKAFDPLTLPDPDIHAPIDERKIGGLGVFMMKELMDSVTYSREQDQNVLTLTKYNSCNPKESHCKDQEASANKDACCRWPLDYMKKETFKKGDWLFKKGDEAEKMYYISEGAVNLVEINKVIEKCAVIGEMGIFSPYKQRTASAQCVEDLVTYTMGKDEVIKFFGKDPTSAIELIQLSVKRFMENLQKETAALERIESELRIATEIQMSMIPNVFPKKDEFEIYGFIEPAKEVGGDFYDFFFIDENRLCFVIGDVSGKGVPAALFMAITKTLIKNEAKRGLSTDEILANVNNIICPDNSTCQFVTVFCVIMDIPTGKLQFCNAGHNPPLLFDNDGCKICTKNDPDCDRKGCYDYIKVPGGFVVGVIENTKCQEKEMQLNPYDTIFLYTDGVTEAMNPRQEQFSEERLSKALTELKDFEIKDIILQMRKKILDFADGAQQSDDITMIALRYYGSERKSQDNRVLT